MYFINYFTLFSPLKLLDRMNVFLQDPATKFHETATRLYMKIRYEVDDVFAADIYFHNSSYIKFALTKIEQKVAEPVELLKKKRLEEFFFFGAKEKDVFLLSELPEHIKRLK